MRPVKEKKIVQSLLSKLFCTMKLEKKKKQELCGESCCPGVDTPPKEKKRKKHVKLANHVSLQPHSLDESGFYLSTFKES
jgi:hypothetical protein